jgi:hypothetical protein
MCVASPDCPDIHAANVAWRSSAHRTSVTGAFLDLPLVGFDFDDVIAVTYAAGFFLAKIAVIFSSRDATVNGFTIY